MSTHEGSDGDRAGNHVVSFIRFPNYLMLTDGGAAF